MIYRFEVQGEIYQVSLENLAGHLRVSVDGEFYEVEILDRQPGMLSLRLQGRPSTLYWALDSGSKWVSLNGCTYRLEKPSPRRRRGGAEGSAEDSLRAPMPAQVRSVDIAEGDRVEKGQMLMLLEAMKMEIRLQAPRAGRVRRVAVKQGQSVERDEILLEIDSQEAAA